MDIQKEKEAFEAWYCRNHTGLKQSDLAKFRTLSGYSFSDSLKINVSWEAWQAAKAQVVLEKDAIIQKLSDQLYAQEMKTSGARVLCETACELLDGYAHQDAMVILNDLEQAMKEPTND